MHGPLPLDVTLDAPHWWLPGMPLLPPADYKAPVPLKRKRDTSAEPKTEPAKRAYRRTPDEAKLWFQDFHAYQARVHGTFAGRSIWCRSSSGPWHPTHSAGGMKARRTRPPRQTTRGPAAIRPFASCEPHSCRRGEAQSQRPLLAARLPPCAARARHRIRAREEMDAAVSSQPAALMEARGDLHPQQAERG